MTLTLDPCPFTLPFLTFDLLITSMRQNMVTISEMVPKKEFFPSDFFRVFVTEGQTEGEA